MIFVKLVFLARSDQSFIVSPIIFAWFIKFSIFNIYTMLRLFMGSKLVRLGRYDYLILRLLFLKSSTPYEIYLGIFNIYRGFSHVYASNVYQFVSQLESLGFIRCIHPCPVKSRSLFEITKQGSDVLSYYLEIDSRSNLLFPITRAG